MQLVQILLPLTDNSGQSFPSSYHHDVQKQLTKKFGGLTSYVRSPAEGRWRNRQTTHHDDIVVYEVMTPQLNRTWWKGYRRNLEKQFQQSEVVIRAQTVTLI